MIANTLRLAFFLSLPHCASSQPSGAKIPLTEAIDRSLKANFPAQGATPFHAVMSVTGPTPAYSGTIDLSWASADTYRLSIQSPAFTQLQIVNGKASSEQHTGDYFPRWLETLALALLNPKSLTANFRSGTGDIPVGSDDSRACVTRDERTAGITDQLTWGVLCFTGSEPRIESILTFNLNLELSAFSPFGARNVPRTYSTSVLDYKPVIGHLTTLEPLAPNPDIFVTASNAPSDEVRTAFVSTLSEEGMVETAPANTWPTVREGKTEGYMIVYARTDRTGQVRETSKHNSDNPGLEQFGMEQALRYKFRPLIVDGVTQQMEMPLVLHFKSTVADAVPILNDAEMRSRISGCTIPRAQPGRQPFRIRLSVNEESKLTGESYLDANNPNAPHRSSELLPSFRTCRYAPYILNGKPTYYHGDLLLP